MSLVSANDENHFIPGEVVRCHDFSFQPDLQVNIVLKQISTSFSESA